MPLRALLNFVVGGAGEAARGGAVYVSGHQRARAPRTDTAPIRPDFFLAYGIKNSALDENCCGDKWV